MRRLSMPASALTISAADPANSVETIERFQALHPGQYWRARTNLHDEPITVGDVLLIESVRWVEDKPHTVILRAHPRHYDRDVTHTWVDEQGEPQQTRRYRLTEHRFLLDAFLQAFEFEPDAKAIRQSELARVQEKIGTLQQELLAAQTDPAVLGRVVEQGLATETAESAPALSGPTAVPPAQTSCGQDPPQGAVAPAADPAITGLATGSLAQAIGADLSEARISAMKAAAGREHQIACIKANWIQGKTEEIAETIQAMAPFYAEQAAAALAQTEDVRDYVGRLQQGIESLDLYVGRQVRVDTLTQGADAPAGEPLTFVQKKLLMDEELAAWADVDARFDFRSQDSFFEALRAHPGLVQQIFPTERCVLVMATTRRHIDYGDPLTNYFAARKNEEVFLLVRNGENLYRVVSPVESHLGSARLFPSRAEQDDLFRGIDGSQIKFEDVAYTDHLKDHELAALHYKRFLILMCGLDHRLQLFGRFYPGPASLDFVSLAFQQAYCRFLHDDDAGMLLPGQARPTLEEWIRAQNRYLRSGSRVLCHWRSIMTQKTAPGACKEYSDHYRTRTEFLYEPVEEFACQVAYKQGKSLCVDVEVAGRTRNGRNRAFTCKVDLGRYQEDEQLGFLCLDAVSPDDLRWYIHHRDSRRNHLFYIRFFKLALKFVLAERAAQAPARAHLRQALLAGGVAAEAQADGLVDQAVIAWMASHRGQPLPDPASADPSTWKGLLDQMFRVAQGQQDRAAQNAGQDILLARVTEFAAAQTRQPLRLVATGTGQVVLYVAPDPQRDDCDARLCPHHWVMRQVLSTGKEAFTVKASKWAWLPAAVATETTLYEWPAAAGWVQSSQLEDKPLFESFAHKQAVFAHLNTSRAQLNELRGGAGPLPEALWEKWFSDWQAAYSAAQARSKAYVQSITFSVPIGVYGPTDGQGQGRYLCVGTCAFHALLHQLAPDESSQDRVRRAFIKPYGNKTSAESRYYADVQDREIWTILERPLPTLRGAVPPFGQEAFVSSRQRRDSPLLADQVASLHLQHNNRCGIWWHPDFVDQDGNLTLDALLGIELPADYELVVLHTVTLYKDDKVIRNWFDLLPEGALSEYVDKMVGRDGVTQSQHSSRKFYSRTDARNAIARILNGDPHTEISLDALGIAGGQRFEVGVEHVLLSRRQWYS